MNVIVKGTSTGLLGLVLAGTISITDADAQGREPRLPVGNAESIYGKITDQYGKPLPARVELWYPDLDKPVVEEFGTEVTGAAIYDRQLFHAVHSNNRGWYNLEAIPGTWLVRVSRGPEYEVEEFEVVVEEIDGGRERDGQRHDVTLDLMYDKWGYDIEKMGWLSGDMHHHGLASDGAQTVAEIYEAAIANDLDFLSLTEHNQNVHNEEWLTYNNRFFTPLPGNEVSTNSGALSADGKGFGHHISIIDGLPGATDPEDARLGRYNISDVSQLQFAVDETRRMGGLWAPTHSAWPTDWPNGTLSDWGALKRYHAIDIFIGWDVGPHLETTQANGDFGAGIFGKWQYNINTMMTQIWFEMLNAGNKIAAWGSSDSHNTLRGGGVVGPTFWRNTTGNARVYVNTKDMGGDLQPNRYGKPQFRETATIKDALKQGRAFVTAGYWGPLLIVDSNGVAPGEEMDVANIGDEIPLTIKLLSNRPIEGHASGIRVIHNGKVVQEIDTTAYEGAYKAEIETTVQVEPVGNGQNDDGWLAVQAFTQWPSTALTNAIYLNFSDDGVWGNAEWTFPVNAKTWFNEFSDIGPNPGCSLNVPAITVPDGPIKSPWATLPEVTPCDFFVIR